MGDLDDLTRAHQLCAPYATLRLGLVDAIVAATVERLRARAIATLDLRDFSPLRLLGNPTFCPRDLPRAG